MTKQDVFDLIKDAAYGTLATIEGSQPKVRPMMPYLDEETGKLLIATYTKKRVVGQIEANSSVEMCFIDRKMNFSRVSGEATLTKEQSKKEILWNNIPILKQHFSGPEDPNLIVIEINSDKVEVMTPQDQEPEVLSFQ